MKEIIETIKDIIYGIITAGIIVTFVIGFVKLCIWIWIV